MLINMHAPSLHACSSTPQNWVKKILRTQKAHKGTTDIAVLLVIDRCYDSTLQCGQNATTPELRKQFENAAGTCMYIDCCTICKNEIMDPYFPATSHHYRVHPGIIRLIHRATIKS